MKKISNILGVIIIFILFFVAFTSLENENKSGNKSEPIDYKIGDTISCKDYDVTFNSYDIKNYQQDDYIVDGDQWIALYLTVVNTSDSEISFSEDKVKYINSNGEKISNMTLTVDIWDGDRLNNFKLVSGGSKTGYIVFREKINDTSNIHFQFSCNSGLYNIFIN